MGKHTHTSLHIQPEGPRLSASTILGTFKSSGKRITRLREGLVKLLEKAGSPLSVPEMLTALHHEKITVNKTSIYRELELFLKEGIATQVDFLDRTKRYELMSPHHHHFICSSCERVACIDACVDLSPFYKSANKLGFTVRSHVLEFFGTCSSCK